MSNELNPHPHSPDNDFYKLETQVLIHKLEIEKLNEIIKDLKSKLGEYNTITLSHFNPERYPENIALKANWGDSIYYFKLDDKLDTYGENHFKIYVQSYIKITKEEDYSIFDNKIDNSKIIEHRNKKSFIHPEDSYILLPKDSKVTIISENQYNEIIENCKSTFDNLFFGLNNPKNDLNTLY